MGDSDPKAWIISLVGGVIGGLLDRGQGPGAVIGALVPTIIYQLGLPPHLVDDEMGIGQSQFAKGFARAFTAVFASLMPGFVGMMVGLLAGWLLTTLRP